MKKLPYRSLLGGIQQTAQGLAQTPVVTASPDVSVVDLYPADWAIVMGGHGVFDVLADQEILDVCLETISTMGKGPVEAAKAVTAKAAQRGSKDNLTCIVMRLGWASPPAVKTLA